MPRGARSTVLNVAEYILAKYQSVDGLKDDPITHMKLQKLVYYAQGFSLALCGEPLFDEPLEAWRCGPVSPGLYQEYKKFERRPVTIDKTPEEAGRLLSGDQIAAADLVVALYGFLTAASLLKMARADEAWDVAKRTGETVLDLDAVKRSCQRRLAIKSRLSVPTADEVKSQWKLADELGIPDSLDA